MGQKAKKGDKMAELRFNISQNDGLNVWIKQTLQDNLTGEEFSKLENVLNKNSFQDLFSAFERAGLSSLSNLHNKIKEFLSIHINSTVIHTENDTNLEEIKEIEQKAREILIYRVKDLNFNEFKNLLKCAHIKQNGDKCDNLKEESNKTHEDTDFFLHKEADKAESKEESSDGTEYKIGGNLLEMLRQNLTGREFREFSEYVENDTELNCNNSLLGKAREILVKGLESYPILIAISKKEFFGFGTFSWHK